MQFKVEYHKLCCLARGPVETEQIIKMNEFCVLAKLERTQNFVGISIRICSIAHGNLELDIHFEKRFMQFYKYQGN